MITIDRKSSYLAWRIDQNPYYDYRYLLYFDDRRLKGYAIFMVGKGNACVIEDILAERGDLSIFKIMIEYLIWHAKEINADAVVCNTLRHNKLLQKAFSHEKFINLYKLKRFLRRKDNPNAFHVYVEPEIRGDHDFFDPQKWYVTDIVKEGRTR